MSYVIIVYYVLDLNTIIQDISVFFFENPYQLLVRFTIDNTKYLIINAWRVNKKKKSKGSLQQLNQTNTTIIIKYIKLILKMRYGNTGN